MAKLTAAARKKLPKKAFGLPAKRMFPLTDMSHDQAAIRDAPRAERAGSITAAQAAAVSRAARKKLKQR